MIKIKLSPSEWLKIAVLFVVFVGGSIASYVVLQPKRVLPIYNPSDLNPAVVDDDLERKGRGHRIGDFELVDQWGQSRRFVVASRQNICGRFFLYHVSHHLY